MHSHRGWEEMRRGEGLFFYLSFTKRLSIWLFMSRFLSLTIWCCSLLIMIISASLSCIVHLCNNISSIHYLQHTSPFIPARTLCTFPPAEMQVIKSVLFEILNVFTVLHCKKETQKERMLNSSYLKCKSVLLYPLLCGWICTTGTMDKISQDFSDRTIWLSTGG